MRVVAGISHGDVEFTWVQFDALVAPNFIEVELSKWHAHEQVGFARNLDINGELVARTVSDLQSSASRPWPEFDPKTRTNRESE